ncbi:ESPR-type extended signal peptide-containing protein, partial [Paraburkholderia sp. BR14261]
MNRTYKSVWNEITRTWVAAAENAKGKRKGKGNVKAMVIAVAVLGVASQAHAYVAGGSGNTAPNDSGIDSNLAIGSNAYAADTSSTYLIPGDGRHLREYNLAIGASASATGAGTMAIGQYTLASGQNAGVVGFGATATGAFGTVVGSLGTAAGTASSALGYLTVASGDFSAAMGSYNKALGYASVAMGASTTATGDKSVAIGSYSTTVGDGSVAIGRSAVATNANDVALGGGATTATVVNTAGVTIGGNSYSFAGTNAKSTISVGSAGKERTLTNVAAGQLTAASTDAVNGSELFATNQQVTQNTTDISNLQGDVTNINGQLADAVMYDTSTHDSVTLGGTDATTPVALHNVAAGAVSATSFDAVNGSQLYNLGSSTADSFGGGSTVNSDGSISNPTYNVGGNTYNNVGGAITNLDGRVTQNTTDITNLQGDVTNINGQLADAVMYDTSKHSAVTLGGTDATTPVALHNVAAGQVSATSFDAVNGAQLYETVTYDTSTHDSVTLGGAVHAPVVLTNVANAALNATSLEAVNGSQLYALGAKTDAAGNITNAFVAYDDTSLNTVTFGGSGHAPVVLHNVANGVDANDAVNVAQLEAMGAKIDPSGNISNAFVAYDDTSLNSVTLGGSLDHKPVALHNVANGVVAASSTDAVNGGQLYGVASSTASALGGGSTVNPDGSISAPTYVVGGNTYNDVGGAISNIDGRVTNIEQTVTNISGQVANAVQYDSSAHDKVTLGGTDSTTPVKLTNLQDAELSASSTDAVTGSQLYATNVVVSNLNQQIQNISVNGTEYLSTNTTSGAASATGASSIAAGGGAIASGPNATAIGDSAKATGNNSVALGANSIADEDNTVSVGSQGNERRIAHVANGVNATDAVNMGQLQSGLNGLQSNVNSVARNAYGGIAAATALTMIPEVDQGKTVAVGIGTANFQGYQAVALGASARITQNLKV